MPRQVYSERTFEPPGSAAANFEMPSPSWHLSLVLELVSIPVRQLFPAERPAVQAATHLRFQGLDLVRQQSHFQADRVYRNLYRQASR